MKVKIFTTFYYPKIIGGGEISTQLLVEGLKQNRIDIEVVTLGEEDKSYMCNGVKVSVINCQLRNKIYTTMLTRKQNFKVLRLFFFFADFFDIFFYKKIKKQLEEADIIHITNYHYYSCIPLIYKLRNKNIKIIQSIRAPIFQENESFLRKLWAKFSKELYNKYNKYIIYHFPTKYMYNYLKNRDIKFNEYFIIGNTVNIENEKIDLKRKKIDICYSGVIEEYKGIITLIKAIKNLRNKVVDLEVTFVGEGSLKKEAQKNRIKVTGWITKEENYNIIKHARVLVLPSEWDEAFGRVIIEAINLGTLVVGSNCGAIPEVLNYNENYIFEAKNHNELEKKIERILNLSEEEYIYEIENLRKEIEKYSYKNHIFEFIKKYKEVLGEIK